MTTTPLRKLSWFDWFVIVFFAMVAVGTLFAVLQQRFGSPAVRISLVDPAFRVVGRPGESVPYEYQIEINQAPTVATIVETWWAADTQKTMIADVEPENRSHPTDVNRIIRDEAIAIPRTLRDGTPIQCGQWEYRRAITALTDTGVYRTSILVVPVEITGCS